MTPRITGPQQAYLKRLLDQAFARLIHHGLGLDRHHLDGVSRAEASAAIDALKRLLAKED
jgi:hypothetical protein